MESIESTIAMAMKLPDRYMLNVELNKCTEAALVVKGLQRQLHLAELDCSKKERELMEAIRKHYTEQEISDAWDMAAQEKGGNNGK